MKTSKEALIIPSPLPPAQLRSLFKGRIFLAALRYSIMLTFHDVIVF